GTVSSASSSALCASSAEAVWLCLCGSVPITIMCLVPSFGVSPAKRIAGGHASVRAGAKLLSGHADDPRAAVGDTTHVGQSQLDDSDAMSQPIASPRTYRPGRTTPSRDRRE